MRCFKFVKLFSVGADVIAEMLSVGVFGRNFCKFDRFSITFSPDFIGEVSRTVCLLFDILVRQNKIRQPKKSSISLPFRAL